MTIIALDISLNVGYAIGDGTPENTLIGTTEFHRWKDDIAVLGRKFSGWLGDTIGLYNPEALVIEKTIHHATKLNYRTTQILNGLAWEAHREAEFCDMPRFEYAPATVKKSLTGTGRADKKAMIKAAREKGFRIETDHEADAVALLLLHLHETRNGEGESTNG